jgi:hypothetical protein
VRAVGARDLVLGIIVLILLAGRNRSALELVLGVASGRSDAGPEQLGVHVGGAATLLLAWQCRRSGR